MSTQLQIEILDPTADDQELDELTESLRQDLLELDVDSVSRPTLGPGPEGSKGLDLAAVGALLVALKSWSRSRRRSCPRCAPGCTARRGRRRPSSSR